MRWIENVGLKYRKNLPANSATRKKVVLDIKSSELDMDEWRNKMAVNDKIMTGSKTSKSLRVAEIAKLETK
jgi:hypothetical protein